mgnify:FL=1
MKEMTFSVPKLFQGIVMAWVFLVYEVLILSFYDHAAAMDAARNVNREVRQVAVCLTLLEVMIWTPNFFVFLLLFPFMVVVGVLNEHV